MNNKACTYLYSPLLAVWKGRGRAAGRNDQRAAQEERQDGGWKVSWHLPRGARRQSALLKVIAGRLSDCCEREGLLPE